LHEEVGRAQQHHEQRRGETWVDIAQFHVTAASAEKLYN
jgi:hypothetical protein